MFYHTNQLTVIIWQCNLLYLGNGTAQRQCCEHSRLTRSSLNDWLLETRRSSIHTRVIDDLKLPRK